MMGAEKGGGGRGSGHCGGLRGEGEEACKVSLGIVVNGLSDADWFRKMCPDHPLIILVRFITIKIYLYIFSYVIPNDF